MDAEARALERVMSAVAVLTAGELAELRRVIGSAVQHHANAITMTDSRGRYVVSEARLDSHCDAGRELVAPHRVVSPSSSSSSHPARGA